MRSHDILGNVNARSEQIFAGLRAIQADVQNGGWLIEEVRGKGVSTPEVHLLMFITDTVSQLMCALEFKSPSSRLTSSLPSHLPNVVLPGNLNTLVQNEAMDRGLLTLTTSIYPVLRMIPALILSEEEVDEMLVTLKESIRVVAARVEGQ